MTSGELRVLVMRQIGMEEAAIARHEKVVKALRRHEGKRITRHFNRDLEKVGAKLGFRYGMIYVDFPNPADRMHDYSHLLAYDSNPVFSLESFENSDACQGRAAQERVAAHRHWLATDSALQLEEGLAAMLAAVEVFSKLPFGPCDSVVQGVVKEAFGRAPLYWRIS